MRQQFSERIRKLRWNADFLRQELRSMGYDVGASQTPVIPVTLRDEAVAVLFAARLRELGIIVTPVMFPAVAQGAARLRICVTAAHREEDLEFAIEKFRQLRPQPAQENR